MGTILNFFDTLPDNEINFSQTTLSEAKSVHLKVSNVWRAVIISSCFWLAVTIPIGIIWKNLQELKAVVEGGTSEKTVFQSVIVSQSDVTDMYIDEFQTGQMYTSGYTKVDSSTFWYTSSLLQSSTSESTVYSTSTENPVTNRLEEMMEEKFEEAFNLFRRMMQDQWEQCRCPAGRKGEMGDIGLPGPTGKGYKGYAGKNGSVGLTGSTGSTGEVGERGEGGGQGDIGERGVKGLAGRKGEKGYDGFRGVMGMRGLKGDPGTYGDWGGRGSSVFGR